MIIKSSQIKTDKLLSGGQTTSNLSTKIKRATTSSVKQIINSAIQDEKTQITLKQANATQNKDIVNQLVSQQQLYGANEAVNVLNNMTAPGSSSPPPSEGDSGATFTSRLQSGAITVSAVKTVAKQAVVVPVQQEEPVGDTVLYSGKISFGSDQYNLDTLDSDMRSYNGELLSSFDQIENLYECEIVSLLRDRKNDRIVIVFRLGDYDLFQVKMYDMFFDREIFIRHTADMILTEDLSDYITTDFCNSEQCNGMKESQNTSSILSFTRSDAIAALNRNKQLLINNGINVDARYTIIGDTQEKRDKAKRLLELGVFDYYYNKEIMDNTIFAHKIWAVVFTSQISQQPLKPINNTPEIVTTQKFSTPLQQVAK